MKRTYRIFLFALMAIIALVIGSLVVRQVGMIPHEELLHPTPFPTSQINLTLTVTIRPEIALLSQGLGSVLLETAIAAEGIKITPIDALSPTPIASTHDSNCAFSWAHQDLPDVAEAAREAFSTISMANIQVLRADAYGENCNRADGSLSSFGAMTTDFYLSVNGTDLTDTNQMAQVVVTAYTVLSELKIKLPAQAGYLDIAFTDGSKAKHFRAMFSQLRPLIEGEKSDADLLAVGGLS